MSNCVCVVENGVVVRPCSYDAPRFYMQNVYKGANGTFKSEGRKDSDSGRQEIGYRVTLNNGRTFFTWLSDVAVRIADSGIIEPKDEYVIYS